MGFLHACLFRNPFANRIHSAFFVCFLCISASGFPAASQTELKLGDAMEGKLSGTETASYILPLEKGQFAYAVIEQKGVDLIVSVLDQDGKTLKEVDCTEGRTGREPVAILAQKTGNYSLILKSMQPELVSGDYQIRWELARNPVPEDLVRLDAIELVAAGEKLRRKQASDSLPEASRKFEKAIELWVQLGDRYWQAVTLILKGATSELAGDFHSAIKDYEISLPVWRSLNDPIGEADALNAIGVSSYYLSDADKAIDALAQALQLREQSGDRRGKAETLGNLSIVYVEMGEYRKALGLHEQVLAIYRSIGDRFGETTFLVNAGYMELKLGESQKSLDYFFQALSLTKDRSLKATIIQNISTLYMGLGDTDRALQYCRQGLDLRKEIGDQHGEAYALTRLGQIYASAGDFQKALDSYSESLQILHSVGDRSAEANALMRTGELYEDMHAMDKAADYYNKAIEITKEIHFLPEASRPLRALARIRRNSGELDKADALLQESLSLSRTLGDAQGEAETQYELSCLSLQKGEPDTARSSIDEALQILESIRGKIASQELRASFLGTVRDVYETDIEILMALQKLQPSEGFDALAFRAAESAHARSLLELLTESRVDFRQGIDPALLQREKELQELLQGKLSRQMKLLGAKNSNASVRMAQEIETLTAELEQVRGRIRVSSPRYAELTQPEPLPVSEIQKLLDPETVLLEFVLGKTQSYVWALTDRSLKTFVLPGRQQIEDVTRELYQRLAAKEQQDAIRKESGKLSQLLLGPVLPELNRKRLLIVADGALEYIPFAALPDPVNPEVPMMVHHEIVGLPSASVLAALRRDRLDGKAPDKTLAVFADPVFQNTDERVRNKLKTDSQASDSSSKEDLIQASKDLAGASPIEFARLPFSRREAVGILNLVPATKRMAALDFDASRDSAMDPKLAEYRYIHFATHGFFNGLHPELSGIVLSLVDSEGKEIQGFLQATDVFNMKLRSDLVVLSACRTALGKEIKGEGLVGLSRGFFYAGSQRVMASLWKVDDAAAAEMMRLFYEGMLRLKLSPAAALQNAQIHFWKEKRRSHPFYWAAFVLQGLW